MLLKIKVQHLSNFHPVRSALKTEVHFVPYFFLVQPTKLRCNCV